MSPSAVMSVSRSVEDRTVSLEVGTGTLALLCMSNVVCTLIFDTYKNGIKYLPDSNDYGTHT